MADDVPADLKRRRLNQLLAVQERIGLELNLAWRGREAEVLVERVMPNRRGAEVTADAAADSDPAGDGAAEPAGIQDEPESAGIPNLAGTAGEGSVALAGRSRENKLVHLAGDPSLVGSTVRVHIDYAGPFALRGKVVAAGAVAAPKPGTATEGAAAR
jgi:tRNA A37 methylthiotransferase MiaB